MSVAEPIDDGAAAHLVAGLRLPKVELLSTQGGVVDPTELGRAVIYVYPWTGRPGFPNPPHWDDIVGAHGSTPQAEAFAALHERFLATGLEVYGLSGQTSVDQREFAGRLKLPFALLSDHGFGFADALRLPRFETGGVAYLKRLTLLVRDGAIAGAIYPVTRPAGHAAEIIARARALAIPRGTAFRR